MENVVFFEPKSWWKDDYWKVLALNFSVMGNMVFFWVKKLMEKMIFTDQGKVLVLNVSVVGNTVFFWVKKLMERWYLLVTEKFLFWTFRWWEIWSFFQSKSWWKDDIYLVFLSFPWYSRTWETRFFVGWRVSLTQIFPYKDEIVDSILIGKIRVRENPSSGKIYSVIHLLRKVFVNWCFERKIIISTREGKNHINLLVQIFELILTFFSHNAKNDVFF